MAISTVNSYEDLLYELQQYEDSEGVHYPRYSSCVIGDSQICEINLATRQITITNARQNSKIIDDDKSKSTLNLLSTEFDHNAEVVYFKCPRYYDNMDLANTVCIIEYLNAPHTANGKSKVQDSGFYWVPYYDIEHYDYEIDDDGTKRPVPIMYIPWAVGGLATQYAGTIEFTVRFYIIDSKGGFSFNMSMEPCEGKVLHGLDLIEESDIKYLQQIDEDGESYVATVYQVGNTIAAGIQAAATYWTDL